MSTLLLEIVTPERTVYSKDVNMVIIRGVEGEMGILPNHVPTVTPLKISAVTAKIGSNYENIAVSGGFAEVRHEKVVILAESAELPGEIDVDRAELAKKRAEERIRNRNKETVDYHRAELALQRALNRLNTRG
ncbi:MULTISPECIES: F0F1 ATP synthase subunit epsilon [unclassified Paenibacillus]|uniref:F0F1 ATP synthase subunit epsilon n=1 Tax=Paenibacillus TaxID=44249 RepID=UPI00038F6A3F|nr:MULTISPECIES: F0F1 ATP synthase subunit epsilon [unclassified Paenibacillus]KKC48071.1 ATP synthase F1 subunit epsilon [Paenibacillus sp. D9]CDN42950.1 ATP synthase epsilon chain [Paenibacillus sp. P22]